MESKNQRIVTLILKYLCQELDTTEKAELDTWVNASERNRQLLLRCTDEQFVEDGMAIMDQLGDEHVWENEKVWKAIGGKRAKIMAMAPVKRKWLWVAACFTLILGVAGYCWKTVERNAPVSLSQISPLSPGVNKAVLQLSDGSIIPLDSVGNGSLTRQGNTTIIKLDSGQLAYQTSNQDNDTSAYNTILTPRGGEYQVILADGSKVWLNAASSLRFPVHFRRHTDRVVELSGEAYFEVAQDVSRPFRVSIANANERVEIEVLGTHFNVMAYADEYTLRTTLLEGAVRVKRGANSALLQPGQQARVKPGSTYIEVVKDIDPDQVIAWKNGNFEFSGEDIQSVMRQLSRWYNIDVQYTGAVSEHFIGTIPRNVSAWEIFKMLEVTGAVKFSEKNSKIIVSPGKNTIMK
ncbi:FecR family protein [Chitinophaga sp. 30R24]|uniref:FecR family protein n=1 Tax=Chitinophaga sp. 30R24 TaxID=3248838 RepID=UPI003B90D666